MTKEFIKIYGFEKYGVSKDGRVISYNYAGKGNNPKELKIGDDGRGYPQVTIVSDAGKRTSIRVHRLVALTYIVNELDEKYVNHIDGNKLNNNVTNLEWCSHRDNIIHARDMGLLSCKQGELGGHNKLTEKDVIKIKMELKDYYRGQLSDIARKYNMDRSTISKIKLGKLWSHVIV